MNDALDDVARFGPGDHPALVEVSFCCRLCLCRPSLIFVDEDAVTRAACTWCWCDRCRSHTRVALNAEQLTRIQLAPPPDAPIYVLAQTDA
ncbi:MAG TPA: hypothetical protein VH279_02625 [Solirubrobacteraceae bacterium]|nr:hypothetical protein [Solirubrobacteraceae bacterium]